MGTWDLQDRIVRNTVHYNEYYDLKKHKISNIIIGSAARGTCPLETGLWDPHLWHRFWGWRYHHELVMVFVRYTDYLTVDYFHTKNKSYSVEVSHDSEDLEECIWLWRQDGEDIEDICSTCNTRKDNWVDSQGWIINSTTQLLPSMKVQFFPPLPFLTMEGYRIKQQNNFETRRDLTAQKVCFCFINIRVHNLPWGIELYRIAPRYEGPEGWEPGSIQGETCHTSGFIAFRSPATTSWLWSSSFSLRRASKQICWRTFRNKKEAKIHTRFCGLGELFVSSFRFGRLAGILNSPLTRRILVLVRRARDEDCCTEAQVAAQGGNATARKTHSWHARCPQPDLSLF